MPASLKILGIVAVSVLAVVSITAMVGLWTVETWLSPMAPTLYLASALLVVFLVMSAAWFVVTRRELAAGIGVDGASAEERGLQRLVGLAGNVLLGVMALGVTAAWAVDSVRAQFVPGLTSQVQLERALVDPSPVVRLSACEEIFKRGWAFRAQKSLIAALDAQPAVAVKCLQTSQEREWTGVETVAEAFNSAWAVAMLKSQDVAAACEKAPWSPVMAELSNHPPEPSLLYCALDAASDSVRKCCADTLVTRGKLLDLLGSADVFPPDATTDIFRPLVKHGFQPLSLSSEQQQVAATLGTDDEAVRRWIVDLGCSSIDPTEAQPQILGGMMPLVEADSCGLTPKEESKYRAPVAWLRLCEQVQSDESDRPVQQVICEGLNQARTLEAVETASVRVYEAVRATFLERDAEFVESGILEAQRMGGGKDSEDAQAHADLMAQSAIEVFNLTPMTKHTCKKATVSTGLGPPSVNVGTTTNCKRYRNDLTVGEFLGQREKQQKEHKEGIRDPFASKYVKKALAGKSGGNQALRQARAKYAESMGIAEDNAN